MSNRSSENMERQPALSNPGILGSISTTDDFDMDRHCTNVRLCNHYSMIQVEGTRLEAVLVGKIAILHC